jgi:hypothetical protein
VTDNKGNKASTVPSVSSESTTGLQTLIDAAQLAELLRVPESWVRNRTRARTPAAERIPCVRLGRYVRFAWGSPSLQGWLERQRG